MSVWLIFEQVWTIKSNIKFTLSNSKKKTLESYRTQKAKLLG